jgi:hypothetical protein
MPFFRELKKSAYRKSSNNNKAKAPEFPAIRNSNSPGVLNGVVRLRFLQLHSLVSAKQFHIRSFRLTYSNTEEGYYWFSLVRHPTQTAVNNLCTTTASHAWHGKEISPYTVSSNNNFQTVVNCFHVFFSLSKDARF